MVISKRQLTTGRNSTAEQPLFSINYLLGNDPFLAITNNSSPPPIHSASKPLFCLPAQSNQTLTLFRISDTSPWQIPYIVPVSASRSQSISSICLHFLSRMSAIGRLLPSVARNLPIPLHKGGAGNLCASVFICG